MYPMQQRWKMSGSDFHKWIIPYEQVSGRLVGEASTKNSIGYIARRSAVRMWLMIQSIKRGVTEGFRELGRLIAQGHVNKR